MTDISQLSNDLFLLKKGGESDERETTVIIQTAGWMDVNQWRNSRGCRRASISPKDKHWPQEQGLVLPLNKAWGGKQGDEEPVELVLATQTHTFCLQALHMLQPLKREAQQTTPDRMMYVCVCLEGDGTMSAKTLKAQKAGLRAGALWVT